MFFALAGLGLLGSAGWQLFGSTFGEERTQDGLKAAFLSGAGPVHYSSNISGGIDSAQDRIVAQSRPSDGSPVAIIRIPSIGLEKVVVAGTGRAELARGPGLYSSSPMPGSGTNLSIAGHRTTFGAPFLKIGELKPGDRIEITTSSGLLAYEVTRLLRVAPSDLSPLSQSGGPRLTLTTCDPPGSASRRLVVEARLVQQSEKATQLPPAPAANPAPQESDPTDNPVLGDPNPAAPTTAPAGVAVPSELPAALPSAIPAPVVSRQADPTALPGQTGSEPPAGTPQDRPPAPVEEAPKPRHPKRPPLEADGSTWQCNDLIDNDGDGLVDYRSDESGDRTDRECNGWTDNVEAG